VIEVTSSKDGNLKNKGKNGFKEFIKNFDDENSTLVGICRVNSVNIKTTEKKVEYIKIEYVGISVSKSKRLEFETYISSHREVIFNF
jgi:hypothetical protein